MRSLKNHISMYFTFHKINKYIYHSTEIRGFCLMKCSSKTLYVVWGAKKCAKRVDVKKLQILCKQFFEKKIVNDSLQKILHQLIHNFLHICLQVQNCQFGYFWPQFGNFWVNLAPITFFAQKCVKNVKKNCVNFLLFLCKIFAKFLHF